MIIEEASAYIARHRGQYSDTEIRQALLLAGYLLEDVEDSFAILERQQVHGSSSAGGGFVVGCIASLIFTFWIFEAFISSYSALSTLFGCAILAASDAWAIMQYTVRSRGSFMRGFVSAHLLIGFFAGLMALTSLVDALN